jgi:AcrR family transcriptional regulator
MSVHASERGSTTRAQLIQAAVQLIPELGWGAVTTRKVAARAGVHPGVVHYHFASVADLLTQAVVGFTEEALAGSLAVLESAQDLDAGLDDLLATLDRYAMGRPAALLLTESFLAATRDEALRLRLRELLTDFRRQVARWLRRHGSDDDVDARATVLTAALDGLLLHKAIDPDMRTETLRDSLRQLVASRAPRGGDIG